jgi:hypothetical protein
MSARPAKPENTPLPMRARFHATMFTCRHGVCYSLICFILQRPVLPGPSGAKRRFVAWARGATGELPRMRLKGQGRAAVPTSASHRDFRPGNGSDGLQLPGPSPAHGRFFHRGQAPRNPLPPLFCPGPTDFVEGTSVAHVPPLAVPTNHAATTAYSTIGCFLINNTRVEVCSCPKWPGGQLLEAHELTIRQNP